MGDSGPKPIRRAAPQLTTARPVCVAASARFRVRHPPDARRGLRFRSPGPTGCKHFCMRCRSAKNSWQALMIEMRTSGILVLVIRSAGTNATQLHESTPTPLSSLRWCSRSSRRTSIGSSVRPGAWGRSTAHRVVKLFGFVWFHWQFRLSQSSGLTEAMQAATVHKSSYSVQTGNVTAVGPSFTNNAQVQSAMIRLFILGRDRPRQGKNPPPPSVSTLTRSASPTDRL